MEPQFSDQPGGFVGRPLVRVEGREKVTGKAKYSAEIPLPGLTYGVLATSPIAKGKIQGIDTTAAAKELGVIAVLTHLNLPKLAKTPNDAAGKKATGAPMGFMPLTGDEIFYAAQPVALVVADTLEHATYAATLVKVSYAPEKPIANFHDPRAELYDPEKVQDGKQKGHTVRGDAKGAFASAPIQLTATYVHPVYNHNPMEPGSTTAYWEAPDRLVVYESTQGVTRTQSSLSAMTGLPREQVRVITKYLGGGFGCKGSMWPHTVLTV
ncbi:MAG: xanthine dehydrogenase family protein molybdopterin-binding subunit, partial [Hymenobacter sp.]